MGKPQLQRIVQMQRHAPDAPLTKEQMIQRLLVPRSQPMHRFVDRKFLRQVALMLERLVEP